MQRYPRVAVTLLALAAIAVPVGCSGTPTAEPTAAPATSERAVAPTISEVINPPPISPATSVRPPSDAKRTQFRPVVEDLTLDTPADAFEPTAATLVLDIEGSSEQEGDGESVRRLRLGPAIVDRTAIQYTVYQSDDGVEVQFALDRGPEGMDPFNTAAVECQLRMPSCPTGRMAYIMDGTVVADAVVADAPYEAVSILISNGIMGPAPPDSPFS